MLETESVNAKQLDELINGDNPKTPPEDETPGDSSGSGSNNDSGWSGLQSDPTAALKSIEKA